jgi:hypothetical protein
MMFYAYHRPGAVALPDDTLGWALALKLTQLQAELAT